MLRFSDNASFQNERDNSFSLEFVSVPTIHDGRIEKLKSLTEGAVNNHDKHNLQLSISSHPVSANQEYGASASYYTTTSSLPAFMDKQQPDFSSITSSHPKFGDLNHGESFYISSTLFADQEPIESSSTSSIPALGSDELSNLSYAGGPDESSSTDPIPSFVKQESEESSNTSSIPTSAKQEHVESFSTTSLAASPCFVNKDELQQAIGEYAAQDCANKPDCTLGQMYGWPMNSWCVSNVQDLSYLIYWSNFNENISSWDVSNATNMNGMFYYANSFNSDLSGWNVSSVSDMSHMFNGASSFNSDLSGWNVSGVVYMSNMFYGASSFNSDLSGWNVSSVGDMSHMFYGAKSFNQNLCAWSDAFPYNAASNIFFESNCTHTSNPLLERRAPFCAFMCKDYPFISDTFPSDAVDTGGTEIRLVGYNFVIGQVVNQSILYECQFGSIAKVNATLISNNELSCISPEVQLFIGSMVVELTVIIDGQISFNSVPFRFYGICSENLCQYGYCSFGGCLVSLFSVELSLSKTPRHFSNAQIVLSWLPWRKLH